MHGSGLQNTKTRLRGSGGCKLASLNFGHIHPEGGNVNLAVTLGRPLEGHGAEELTILTGSGSQRIPSGQMKLFFLRHPARRARVVRDTRFYVSVKITAKAGIL
jgi:hypothetical protein